MTARKNPAKIVDDALAVEKKAQQDIARKCYGDSMAILRGTYREEFDRLLEAQYAAAGIESPVAKRRAAAEARDEARAAAAVRREERRAAKVAALEAELAALRQQETIPFDSAE